MKLLIVLEVVRGLSGIGDAMVVVRAMLFVWVSAIAGVASPAQPVFPDSRAIVDFQRALDTYAFLHRQVERRVGVTADQRAMAAGMRAARPSPQEGEIFIPLVATAFRHRIAVALKSDGCEMPQLNRQNFEVPRPNGDASMASAIPECVSAAPATAAGGVRWYRAVGSRLVLVDTHAALVVDVVSAAFPQ